MEKFRFVLITFSVLLIFCLSLGLADGETLEEGFLISFLPCLLSALTCAKIEYSQE